MAALKAALVAAALIAALVVVVAALVVVLVVLVAAAAEAQLAELAVVAPSTAVSVVPLIDDDCATVFVGAV